MNIDFGSIPTRIGKALQGVFGSANKRALSQYNSIVKDVNGLEDWAKDLSQEQIQGEVAEMKKLVQEDALALDDAMPKMFALTREAASRVMGMRHFDCLLYTSPSPRDS